MKIRSLAVLVIAAGVLAIWLGTWFGGSEPGILTAQPAQSNSGPKSIQASAELQPATRPRDESLGQPARVAIIEDHPAAADEVLLLDEDLEAAVLVVIALDRATGRPIPNVRVSLLEDTPGYRLISMVEGHVGNFEQAPVTDASGRAEFRLPPGVASSLDASGEDEQVGEMESIPIPALGPGEYRETTIELQVGLDLRLFGRVVEAEGGAPVSGARVRFQSYGWTMTLGELRSVAETHFEVSTDFDGVFEALLPSWTELDGRVDAPGYGPTFFEPVAGHEESSMALQIEVAKGARLRGTLSVTNETSPDQFSVQVTASGSSLVTNLTGSMWYPTNPWWTARVQVDGSWELADLPAGAPLEVELRGPEEELRRHQNDLVLAPGEDRVLDWRLGSGATLRGRAVIAGSGEPCGGQTIWLTLEGGRYRPGLVDPYWEPTAETRTDQEGVFVFADLDAGRWLVGPAPVDLPDELSVAPLAEAVEVLARGQDVDILIELHRGLYIRGRVMDPAGGSARESYVYGIFMDTWAHAECDDDGVFLLGPLPAGEFSLHAEGLGHATSDPVMVNAGAEGVVLRLNPGGAFSGVVIDAESGVGQKAELSLFFEEELEAVSWFESNIEGQFECDGLSAGTYTIKASTDRLVGVVSDVLVSAGSMVENVMLSLEPGASLDVRYDGQSNWFLFEVLMGGTRIDSAWLEPGERHVFLLPAGEATVRFFDWPGEEAATLGELTVTLVVGQEAQVVWPEPKDKR